MNKPLLREIIKEIKKEPLRMNMQRWLVTGDDVAPCGTTGCIAGYAVLLDWMKQHKKQTWAQAGAGVKRKTHSFFHDPDLADKGANLLKLNLEQAETLFYLDDWPKRFRDKYEMANTVRLEEAKVVIQRIQHFIKTGK